MEHMQKGVIESTFKRFQHKATESYGYIFPQYVVEFAQELQRHRLDAHILICGSNGSGKSMMAIGIAKLLNPKADIINKNTLYAFHKTSDFINKIEDLKGDVLIVDEITKFLNYREHADKKNQKLIQFIEIARANRVVFISCARDYRKVDLNYRHGKAQMIIQMIDFFASDKGFGRSYGAVFCSPPIVESAERFGLDYLTSAHSPSEMRAMCENLPSFQGFIFLDDIRNVITQQELDDYEARKQEGITQSMENFKKIIGQKENKEEGKGDKEKSHSNDVYSNWLNSEKDIINQINQSEEIQKKKEKMLNQRGVGRIKGGF
jgi:hypothetical protein